MLTAIQLRVGSPRAELLCGTPREVLTGSKGKVALFVPTIVVGYLIAHAQLQRLFVFRTLARDEPGAAAVPGVRPRVRLLVNFRARGRIDRMERLFAFLDKRKQCPSVLTDTFWLRVSHVLGGRLPGHKVTLALLSREPRPSELRQAIGPKASRRSEAPC